MNPPHCFPVTVELIPPKLVKIAWIGWFHLSSQYELEDLLLFFFNCKKKIS